MSSGAASESTGEFRAAAIASALPQTSSERRTWHPQLPRSRPFCLLIALSADITAAHVGPQPFVGGGPEEQVRVRVADPAVRHGPAESDLGGSLDQALRAKEETSTGAEDVSGRIGRSCPMASPSGFARAVSSSVPFPSAPSSNSLNPPPGTATTGVGMKTLRRDVSSRIEGGDDDEGSDSLAGAGQASSGSIAVGAPSNNDLARLPAALAGARAREEIQANQVGAAPPGTLGAAGAHAVAAPLPRLGVTKSGKVGVLRPLTFVQPRGGLVREPKSQPEDEDAARRRAEAARVAAEESRKQKALLAAAVAGGDIAYVTDYLDGGGDVNVAVPIKGGFYGRVAPLLHLAVEQNQRAIVDLLVTRRAAVNATDEWGNTALHRGCQVACDLEIIQGLVDAGANVNAANQLGCTPIHVACEASGDEEQV